MQRHDVMSGSCDQHCVDLLQVPCICSLFVVPAYSDVGQKYASLFQQAFSVSDFLTNSEAKMHVVAVSESVFHVENLLYPPDISSSAFYLLVLCLLASCWSPGHQNIKVK